MNETVHRDKTRTRLSRIPTRDLVWLARKVRKELNRREEEKRAFRERLDGMYPAMTNFLTGVAWALACRASLRRAHDHFPEGGRTPQSGEMWLPIELLKALRLDIKERGWSPLTASAFIPQQRAWMGRRDPSDTGNVQFRIPFARAELGRRLEVG